MPILTEEERIGTLVAGRYRLESILGRGGTGVVFEATHTWTSRRVAVKLLKSEYARDLSLVRRFLQEARAAAGIEHPNVVQVLDMGADEDGSVYLVLELLRGRSLSAALAEEPRLSPERCLDLLLPVMDALGRAHDQGIIHRDLKPDNIFLRRDSSGAPVPVLLDFGMAQMVHAQWGHATQSGTLVGTPYYMSPEQAEGARELGPPADVWSIGVIWYRCLTGELPFTASTPTALLLAIVGRPAAPLRQRASDVPRELATVIDRSIRADLSERHADMKAFASELRAAAKLLGLSAPPGPTEPEGTDGLAVAPPLARPSTASSRRRLAAVAVLAAGVLGVAAWMVLGPLRADGAPSTADSGGEDRMAADPVAAASPPRNAEAADPPSGASSEPAATNAQGPKSATGTERPADGSARAASSKPASEARRSERTAPEAAGRSATSRLGGDEPAPESATSEGVRPKGVEAAGVGPEGAGSEDDGSELARAARREPEDARPGRDRSDEPQDAVPKRAAGGAGADPGGSTEDGSFGSGGLPEIETEW